MVNKLTTAVDEIQTCPLHIYSNIPRIIRHINVTCVVWCVSVSVCAYHITERTIYLAQIVTLFLSSRRKICLKLFVMCSFYQVQNIVF